MSHIQVRVSKSPFIRFLSFIKPQARFVVGAALMGVGKFTLPLAFPLTFKYVVDVLLAAQPRLDGIDLTIDHACVKLCHLIGLGASAPDKLAALNITLLLLFALQSVASYFRNYWAGIAGNHLIFDLQC